MTEHKNELSDEIKVSIEDGIVIIDHSDAYNLQQERFLAGDHFNKQEKIANNKLIEAEDEQMNEAKRDPVAFMNLRESKVEHDSTLNKTSPEMPTSVTQHGQINEDDRLKRSQQAFTDANPENRAVAEKNLLGLQQQLLNVAQYTNMTQEQLMLAQKKAYMDQGDKLYELNMAANRKDNALTWEVANFSQGAGKTMLNGDVGGSAANLNIGAGVHHGISVPNLDLAEINASTTINNEGTASAQAGVRAVKNIYSNGDHNVFLAAAADMSASNLTGDATQIGVSATGLVVNTHTLANRPTSEIAGANVNVLTGETTAIGSISQTFNADTQTATTARAIGTVGVESGSGGLSFEAYQKTGVEGLTARLKAGLDDVGGTNTPSAGVGVSYGW